MSPNHVRMFACSAALLLLVAAAPQNPPPPALTESIDVSLVNVDVVVTDKAGNHVHGLTRDDFEIRENGKPQPISNFAEYRGAIAAEHASVDAPSTPATVTPAEAPPPQPRTFVVFVDNFYLPRMFTDPVFDALKRLLHEVVRPRDSVAIVSWEIGVEGTLEYTNDLQKLDAQLDTLVRRRARPFIQDPTDEEVNAAELQTARFERIVNLPRGAVGNGGRSVGNEPSVASGEERLMAARDAKLKEKQKIAALRALMSTMAGSPGRKTLVLLSHRLSRVAGFEFIGSSSGPVPAGAKGELDMLTDLQELARTANTYGVTIYPLYVEGLARSLPSAATPGLGSGGMGGPVWLNEMTALQDLADATGGVTASSSVDVAKLLPRLADDLTDYYSLAYRKPTDSRDARKVVVKTKNPAYRVRARQQAIERTETARMEDRVIAELFRPSNSTAIRFGIRTGAMKKTGRTRTLPLTLHIPAASLTTLPDTNGRRGEFSVYIVSATKHGAISDVTHRVQPFTIPESEAQKAQTSSFAFDVELRLSDTTDRIAIAVADDVSKEFGVGRLLLRQPKGPVGTR